MSKTAAIPMDKETQRFQFIFTGQQYFFLYALLLLFQGLLQLLILLFVTHTRLVRVLKHSTYSINFQESSNSTLT